MDKRLLRSLVRSLVVVLAGHCVLTSCSAGTVFFDDFDDGAAQGFVEVGGAWSVVDGKYIQSTRNPPGPYRSYVSALSEYIMDVDFVLLSGQEAKVIYAHADIGEDYRVDFSTISSRLTMPAWGQPWNSREFIVGVNLAYNTTYHVHIEVNFGGVIVWLNKALIHNQSWANWAPLGDGKVGVGTWSASARFDNFFVFDISGGVILFEEEFDDGRADLFTEVGDTWDVDAGSYLQFADSPAGPYRSWVAALWRYVIAVDYTPQSIGETKIIFAHADTGEDYRLDLWLNKSRLCIPQWGEAWQTRTTTLGGLNLQPYRTYTVRVEVSHAGVRVWLNKELRHDEPWAHSYPLGNGAIGVGTYANATLFDNLAVHALTKLAGKTWYVDGSVSQSGDGTSWSEAFKTIQEGIEASAHRDTVIVGPGTYPENIHFKGRNITLRSFDPLDSAVVNGTIIDGRAFNSVVTFQGEEDETCVLSGFTIRNGKSNYGGGILGNHARPTIRHNIISDNLADGGGGLAFCHGLVENNTIRNNQATSAFPALIGGGALYDCDGEVRNNIIATNSAASFGGALTYCAGPIVDNSVAQNSAVDGGGLYVCGGLIENNTISGNLASRDGGGLAHCSGLVQKNTISENSAAWGGGLAHCYGTVQNNTIHGNAATTAGGGLRSCDGLVRDNLIVGNTCTSYTQGGGGLADCVGTIENNTIVVNSVTGQGGGLYNCYTTVVNCIIWGNKASGRGQISSQGGTTVLIHCAIEGGWAGTGEGNLPADPQFVDPVGRDMNPDTYEDNDYHLKATSPCVDTGRNQDWMWGAVDLEGSNRIFFAGKSKTVDMGAYEYGSFRFTIVNVERTPSDQLRLTWTSRPGDTYDIFSTSGLPSQFWLHGGSVASQGTVTTWTSGSTTPSSGIFRVGIQ